MKSDPLAKTGRNGIQAEGIADDSAEEEMKLWERWEKCWRTELEGSGENGIDHL